MPSESITISPAPRFWRTLVHHNTSPQAIQLRRELDLPTDRPIIMTGHQPEFWHTGILAKYLAADAASAALNAHPAWLFVDQDRPDSITLRYPARSKGALSTGTATVRERTPPTAPRDAAPQIASQVDSLLSALSRHAFAPTLSHQLASTLSDLIEPLLTQPHTDLFATQLSRTTLFQSLVAQMSKDPERCISTYNAAAARHPTSGIRPLTASEIQDRWELPLWHLPPGKPRTHVYAEDLHNIPINELAPKALFMTGLMRFAACDLFIHGTGGAGAAADPAADPAREGYDIITENWFDQWLGVKIAPMVLVTATRFLPLSKETPPTATDVARARWRAHRARHDPSLLSDGPAAAAKQHALDQLSLLPPHSRARSDTFKTMHRSLDAFRNAHARQLDELAAAADTTAARFAERDILFDRAWPFALFPQSILDSLNDEVRAGFRGR